MISPSKKKSVLVAGVCLAEKPNNFPEIVEELNRSSGWDVIQRWAVIGPLPAATPPEGIIKFHGKDLVPKFILINKLLGEIDKLNDFEFILVVDDDIRLPSPFLDSYLELTMRYDLSLAQPARTRESYIDHSFVGKLEGLVARRTRFVEIGPLFSIRRELFKMLLPFDETSPMGWGYDLTWPALLEENDFKMGIIDALSVSHNLRPPVSNYDWGSAMSQMKGYLERRPHISFDEAFTILSSYA